MVQGPDDEERDHSSPGVARSTLLARNSNVISVRHSEAFPFARNGSYCPVFTTATDTELKGSSPCTTSTWRTFPSPPITAASVTVPKAPVAIAARG